MKSPVGAGRASGYVRSERSAAGSRICVVRIVAGVDARVRRSIAYAKPRDRAGPVVHTLCQDSVRQIIGCDAARHVQRAAVVVRLK
jgi:hypothetical protein